MKIINPATEEIIREIEEDTKESIEKKFQSIAGCSTWLAKSFIGRADKNSYKDLLFFLKKILNNFRYTLTSEVGKPLQQSRNEINGA